MKKEDIEKIKSQILKSGFPTELEVAKTFLDQKWDVDFNSYYIDKDEQKGREIDLLCSCHFSESYAENEYMELHFSFVVEVKKESSKPWIIFTSAPTQMERIYKIPRTWVKHNIDHNNLSSAFDKYQEKLHVNIGRNAVEGFTSGKDKVFSSLCNTTKALVHAIEADFVHQDKSTDRMFSYFESLIVIEGELLSASLDQKGELELIEEDYIQMKFNYLSPGYNEKNSKGRIIHIVRKRYLADYIQKRRNQFKKIAEDVIDEYKIKAKKKE